jgi:inhibitor of KinA sporulation pathway (predicted exonuclease)
MAGESFIIVDLEATCWEKGTSPARMETIEIGAVRIGRHDHCARAEFGRFVRPVSEPILSDFCTQLTGISQDDVDGAEPFPLVFTEFLDWARTEPFVWCSWGAYDLRQLKTDCARHDLQWPPALDRHLNLKAAFAQQMGCRPLGMKGALQKLGIPLAGKHHRTIDDARNIARIGAILLPALCPPPAARSAT